MRENEEDKLAKAHFDSKWKYKLALQQLKEHKNWVSATTD